MKSSKEQDLQRAMVVLSPTVALYGDAERLGLVSEIVRLRKGLTPAMDASSLDTGIKSHPINVEAVRRLKLFSPHHEACIRTKVNACVGLGHVLDMQQPLMKAEGSPPAAASAAAPEPKPRPTATQRLMSKADVTLDPLCSQSWQGVLKPVAEDYYEAVGGYIEVVRQKRTHKIVALHYRSATQVRVHVDGGGLWHYVINGGDNNAVTYDPDGKVYRLGGYSLGKEYHVARFDETSVVAAELTKANGWGAQVRLESQRRDSGSRGVYHEIIDIIDPTSQNRWYSVPQWLSALAPIDLARALNHYYADFFHNRGVPDLIAVFSGQQLDPKEWEQIKTKFSDLKGLGNHHKTMVLNLPGTEIKLQVEKLAMEMKTDSLSASADALNLAIVTAHRVPPLLAGIQTPGKLGANNELPNALQAFQALVIGQDQRIFQQRLGKTLGSKRAGLGLTLADFEFFTILDEIDIGTADTVSRMREPLARAKASGRDLSAGVRD